MRDTVESVKEESNNDSDHEKSFERTRGSFIACLNRSLDNAFEFLSETGYASAGISDNERVDSRSDHDRLSVGNIHSSEFLSKINEDLKESGVSEMFFLDDQQIFGEEEVQTHLSSIGNNSPSRYTNGLDSSPAYMHTNSVDNDENELPSNIHRCRDTGAVEKELSRSSDEQLVKLSADKDFSQQNYQQGIIDSPKIDIVQDKQSHREKLVYRMSAGTEGELKVKGTDMKERGLRENTEIVHRNIKKSISEPDGRDMTPYLTTEREIFKKILDNARESEQVGANQHRRSSRCSSNVNLRSSPAKSASPAQSPLKKPESRHKGFKKFRESFRRKSNYFLPHKLVVHEDKEANCDVTNAIEFQYHCMQVSGDNAEPITHCGRETANKKGFFKQIFDREKHTKTRRRSFFRSSEMLNQSRAQSRENIARKVERPKSISLFMDKIRNQFDRNGSADSLVNIGDEEEADEICKRTSKGFRFRRSESLRSITSAARFSITSEVYKRNAENANSQSIQMLNARERRRTSCSQNGLQRSLSVDICANNEEFDSAKLRQVMKNRFSCCSIGDNIFDLQLPNHSDACSDDTVFTSSSSPMKDDDITDWIRGLQYSSKTAEKKNGKSKLVGDRFTSSKRKESIADICDSKEYMKFFQQTRLVNGRIQTYL